jgi:hypothetical protein
MRCGERSSGEVCYGLHLQLYESAKWLTSATDATPSRLTFARWSAADVRCDCELDSTEVINPPTYF